MTDNNTQISWHSRGVMDSTVFISKTKVFGDVTSLGGNDSSINVTSLPGVELNPTAQYYSAPVGLLTFTICLAICTLVGNGIVLVVSVRRPFLQPTTNLMVAVLAFMDFGMSTTVVLKLLQYIDPQLMSSFLGCVSAICFSVMNGVGCVTVLLAVSFDRFLAVTFPLSYHGWITMKRTSVVMTAILIPSFLVGVLPIWTKQFNYNSHYQCLYATLYPRAVMQGISLFFVVAVFLEALLYIQVLKVAHKHRTQIAALEMLQVQDEERHRANILRNNVRLMRDFGLVWLTFALCWLPFCGITLHLSLQQDMFVALDRMKVPYTLASMLFMINSALNPFIYAVRFKTFRCSLRMVFGCLTLEQKQAQQAVINEQLST